jgi:hypothetical protein
MIIKSLNKKVSISNLNIFMTREAHNLKLMIYQMIIDRNQMIIDRNQLISFMNINIQNVRFN